MKKTLGFVALVGGTSLLAVSGIPAHAQEQAAPDAAAPADFAAEPLPASDAVAPAEAPAAAEAATAETAAPEERRAGSRMVEEVIVTAQKREEKLMSVPLSVQAFSPEALDARGVSGTADLMKITPALDYGTQAGDFTSVYMRGIGSEAWLTSDPSVATYIDGVYFPFSPSVAQDLGGIERVEVLKGPQGTLFGRNANGGAINVIVKEPDFAKRTLNVSTYYGSFDTSKTTLFANIPLTDTLAANVSAYFNYDTTYWTDDSTIAGGNIPANKIASARIKLRWLPSENSDIRLTVQGAKRDGTSTLAANLRPTELLGGAALGATSVLTGRTAAQVAEDSRNYRVHTDLPIYGHLQSFVTSLTGIYNAEYFDTKLITSYQDHSNPYNYDYDGTEFTGASFNVHKHYAKIQEAEIQFLSNEGTPGADWLTLTAGAFYFNNEQGFDPVEITVGGLDPAKLSAALGGNLENLGIVQLLTGGGDGLGQTGISDALQQLLQGVSNGAFPTYGLSNIGLVNTESWSVFLQATAKLTDTLSLTLGGRYQNERRGVLESNTSVRIGPMDAGIAPKVFDWNFARDNTNGNAAYPLHDTTKGFKPKVALDWKPFDDDTLVYASYQEAVKAHSYNAFAFYLRPAYVPEEEMKAYEVGLKTTLFEGTTRFTVAAWRYDLTNLQTQAISLVNGGALSISTAGNARSQGVEFDITSELFPSYFQGLVLTLNGAYLDATYTKYENAQGHQEGTGIFQAGLQDYTGNRITRSPKYTGSVALSKTWLVPGGPLEATVNTYYNDGFNYEASENPLFYQPSYQTWGAHLSYMWEEHNLRVTLLGQNLTDEFYTGGALLLDFGMLATLAPPRTFGVRLDWTF